MFIIIFASGIVRRRWRPSQHCRRSEVELVLQANSLEVSSTQGSTVTAPDISGCFDDYWKLYENCPIKGRDHILSSVCPQVKNV